jgi:hypothetical protein
MIVVLIVAVWALVALGAFALCKAAGRPTPPPPPSRGTRETPDDRHRGGL